MPIYEYECSECQTVHELIQKFSDPPLDLCPQCQGKVTKLMSLSSFSLKGTGWYTTDYKRAAAPAPAKSGSEATSTTEAAAKPAESSPAKAPESPAKTTN